ncbi:MAG TPA: sensor histidine kinase [Gemmatimonadaceae bacterium]|nr:sensor histidine kinase [Gemmatimonadaceae bacterium]
MTSSSPSETITPAASPLASLIAERLRAARNDLVRRWLDRISARVALNPNRVFPTDDLLNHVPLLIDGIAAYLEGPAKDLDADIPVVAKAMELGALRHAQGFDAYEILKEHEILGSIIVSFLGDMIEDLGTTVPPQELFESWRRISHATEQIRQATMTHFLRLSNEQVKERENRLRRFNRMVSHELKNRVGAIRGAASLLPETWLKPEERERFHSIVLENATGLQHVIENLEALSRVESEARQNRNVLLPQAAAESARQLRDAARARNVTVRIAEDLPAVEVDAATVELSLANYISNAIKYSDPAKLERWVEVSGELSFGGPPPHSGELIVRVRDNGLGIPLAARERLFEQFYRAHGETITGVEGSGLGLSLVRETIAALGGKAWAEFPEEGGSVFAFSLPSRRVEDAAAAGTKRPDSPPDPGW